MQHLIHVNLSHALFIAFLGNADGLAREAGTQEVSHVADNGACKQQ